MNFILLSERLKRRVSTLVWIAVIFVILFIPLKIINDGYVPSDDALRYTAKAVTGGSWQQILVMREGFTIDPNPGWQAFLQWLHGTWGCGQGVLLIFSVVCLMLLVMYCALPWFRRPEAWLAGLFAASLFTQECASRLSRGRPYIFTDAVLIT